MKDQLNLQNDQLISAGFVDSDWNCFGMSYSLNIESRKQNTKLFRTLLTCTM